MRWMCLAASLVFAAFLAGCHAPAPPNKSEGEKKSEPGDAAKKSEQEIKTAFDALQEALDEKDADRIWNLLAKDSRDDADREAKAVKEAFSKLTDKEKARFAKRVGLSVKEMTEITGKLYVKSNSFFTGKADELSDCDLNKVVVAGESATVHYTEEDGDKEKMAVEREQGQWKFAVPVAKAVLK